jgi:hypothetical protein
MGSQTELTISITMIVLFSVAIIGFSIGFAIDNKADMSVADDPSVLSVYTTQKNSMTQLKQDTEDTHQSILDTTVEPGSDVVPSAAPFAITISGLTGALKNIITLPVKYIFGGYGSPFGIFFTTLIAVIALLFILYLIKTWKGNP